MSIPYLQRTSPLVDGNLPTDNALDTLNALIKAANDEAGAGSALAGRVDALNAAFALQASYPESFTPPFIQADNLGNVTIAAHTRFYSDGTSVAVNGDVLATGEAAASVLRLYYDDAGLSGGAVAYLYTVDPATAPIQAAGRHVVGKVVIPAGAPVSGTYLVPPGNLP